MCGRVCVFFRCKQAYAWGRCSSHKFLNKITNKIESKKKTQAHIHLKRKYTRTHAPHTSSQKNRLLTTCFTFDVQIWINKTSPPPEKTSNFIREFSFRQTLHLPVLREEGKGKKQIKDFYRWNVFVLQYSNWKQQPSEREKKCAKSKRDGGSMIEALLWVCACCCRCRCYHFRSLSSFQCDTCRIYKRDMTERKARMRKTMKKKRERDECCTARITKWNLIK